MASVWERIGEAAGYAIGAAIFGPSVALARRERRIMRRAFHDWLDEIDAERLPPIVKGITRRSGSLRGTEPIPFGTELDPFEKRARIDVALALGRCSRSPGLADFLRIARARRIGLRRQRTGTCACRSCTRGDPRRAFDRRRA